MRRLVPALLLTLLANGLGVLQPKFVQYAIDEHILKSAHSGLVWLALAFLGVKLLSSSSPTCRPCCSNRSAST